ncbi:hypothetical protein [Luteimonas terricola]|uniref:Carboxypeptidase regulatory-like domain-containing protein n=1 Tax=Luteimonas terricola TaxID=645597 RepID=A0ABQ2EF43_9GAMM|nr:hypothetical protein [Luteimonas terricola]GGK05280.1 hypothetical protein GCM10011394_13030 [Luteimonas terricola]
MSLETIAGLLLALAVLAATLRQSLRWLRLPAPARPAGWRMALLPTLQLACAALLYCTLLPPQRSVEAPTLVVLTARADPALAERAIGRGERVVALPEADPAPTGGVERMPDLATALRMHPATARLRIVGEGLAARDVDPAKGLALEFEPAPPARGFIGLQASARVVAGATLRVVARVHEAGDGVVELVDPAGTVQDRALPDAGGRVLLQAPARARGPVSWHLRLRDSAAGDAAVIEEAAVAVDVVPGGQTRILLLAGAPNPEVKYLRRWAADAGLHLQSRMALGAGAVLGDGPLAIDADTLAGFDLVIVDERAWNGLTAAQRTALLAAVEQGLGLLWRITSAPEPGTRAALHELGFAIDTDAAAPGDEVRLGPQSPPGDSADVGATAVDPPNALPALARQPLRLAAIDGVALLRDRDGEPLALWRGAGRGRVAAWNLDQSFRLVLTGHGERHARLWSEAVGTLARARAAEVPHFIDIAREGQRAILCGIQAGATLVAEDGTRIHPLPDPGAGGCAAAWPTRAGWHRTGDGDAAVHLHVRDAAALPGVEAHMRREATLRLAGAGPDRPAGTATSGTPASRWPWFLAWLATAGLLWWLERRPGR